MMYFSVLALIGITLNIILYIDDIKNRGSILSRVDKGDNLKDLMSTPVQENRRRQAAEAMAQPDDHAEMEMNMDYKPIDYDVQKKVDE